MFLVLSNSFTQIDVIVNFIDFNRVCGIGIGKYYRNNVNKTRLNNLVNTSKQKGKVDLSVCKVDLSVCFNYNSCLCKIEIFCQI